VPVAAVVALAIVGFWAEEMKPLGPVHAYVAPVTVEAVKFNVVPAQIGPLFPTVGAEGIALTVTLTVSVTYKVPLQAPEYILTVYVPAAAGVVQVNKPSPQVIRVPEGL
jgi:hypothetical protein